MKLTISTAMTLPPEALTETFAVLGKRGSGKTNFGVVLVEELVGASLPVVVLDPVGVWWGLRSSADGKSAGLPVTILGGEHGDVPLELGAGAVIADFVVEARQPCVLDLSLFRKGEQVRFMTDFAERLYHAKATKRDALHVVVDEADAFAPQRPQPNELVGELVSLTASGLAAAGGPGHPMTRAEIIDVWRTKLRAGERRMLDAVLTEGEITREDLGSITDIEASGGTFSTYLGVLKRNDLVITVGNRVRLGTALAEAS